MRYKGNYSNVWDSLMDSKEQIEILKIKADLMVQIVEIIKEELKTQKNFCEKSGIYQSRASDLMNGKIHLFSIESLINIASKVGRKCQFSLKKIN